MRDEWRKIYDDLPMTVLEKTRSGVFKRLGLPALLSLALMGLGACQQTVNSGQLHNTAQDTLLENDDNFAYGIAQATIREGLKNITARYIEPIGMDVLAISGMQGLATIDPSLHVKFDANKHTVELFLGETSLQQLSTPLGANSTSWAYLTTKVIRAARLHSIDLKNSNSERIFEAVFDGMMSNLDIFSRYAGGEEARTHRAQRDGFGGIGILFNKAQGGILVTHVNAKSPARKAGLKVDDLIVQIEGAPVPLRSKRNVIKVLRGPVGSLVAITVLRQATEENDVENAKQRRIDFNLRRTHIVPETVQSEVKDAILTLRISSFNKSTSTSVHSALSAHKADFTDGTLTGVILDLRGNPGGLLSQSVNVADQFLEKGLIISTRGRHNDSIHDYTAGDVDLIQGLPLVVLVDGNSASAAEIVASALQDSGRAALVGSTSYGKGTVQTVVRLPNDGEITLTWSRLISRTGYALHGLGVMPSVCATNESNADNILAMKHIKQQQQDMARWWAMGEIFDGQRRNLRKACPSKIFTPTKANDLLIQLAERVINDDEIYQSTLLKPDIVNTALRH